MQYRLETNSNTMLSMYDSAIVRYQRQDSTGAADTIRNIARAIDSDINFFKLEPTKGTIEDAITAFNNSKPKLTLKILKHIHLELAFGRLVA